jgi:fructose-bisphosphate aldolase class II
VVVDWFVFVFHVVVVDLLVFHVVVVDYAHQFDVTVEGELGVLAGVEDEVSSDHHTYTDPEEVIDFATRTGCDSLAISIGTSHGAYKFTPDRCDTVPE